jgi:hypothetical protein
MGGMNLLMHCIGQGMKLSKEAAELLQPKVAEWKEEILSGKGPEAFPGARRRYYQPLFLAIEHALAPHPNEEVDAAQMKEALASLSKPIITKEEIDTQKKDSENPSAEIRFRALTNLGYYHLIGVLLPKDEALIYFAKGIVIDDEKMGGMNQLMACLEEGMKLPREAAELLQPKVAKWKETTLASKAVKSYYKPLFLAIEQALAPIPPMIHSSVGANIREMSDSASLRRRSSF